MVQRGILATFIIGWLLDRAFEAGIDDDIRFYGTTLFLPDVVRCVCTHVCKVLWNACLVKEDVST